MNPPNQLSQQSIDYNAIIRPPTMRGRIGLATLGGFVPPNSVSIGSTWKLIKIGGKKDPCSFPPPIANVNWQGFSTKEVSGYGRKLFWVSGYGVIPADYATGQPMLIMFQWWHTEQVNITDYRMISPEDWDNANIYIAPIDRLDDAFIKSQLMQTNESADISKQENAEFVDVIELPPAKKVHKDEVEN